MNVQKRGRDLCGDFLLRPTDKMQTNYFRRGFHLLLFITYSLFLNFYSFFILPNVRNYLLKSKVHCSGFNTFYSLQFTEYLSLLITLFTVFHFFIKANYSHKTGVAILLVLLNLFNVFVIFHGSMIMITPIEYILGTH